MTHCSCSVFLSLIFSFPLSFLSFSPFFVGARVFFMIFFPHQAIFIPPPPGGGYFPIYRPLHLAAGCASVNLNRIVLSSHSGFETRATEDMPMDRKPTARTVKVNSTVYNTGFEPGADGDTICKIIWIR
jgi:hypothetical protein